MSRIDQALRIWERANGAEASEPETPSQAVRCRCISTSTKSRVGTYAKSPTLIPRPLSRRRTPSGRQRPRVELRLAVATLPDNADIQARLVTGPSSHVSLEQYRRLAAALHE